MKVKQCKQDGCSKYAQLKGLCRKHGGFKLCKTPDCTSVVVTRGNCIAHGGGRRCSFSGCSLGAISGYSHCFSHGGGKKCTVSNCQTPAKKEGKCYRHGGKNFCSVKDCDRANHYRGRCCRHGGFRLCNVIGCNQRSFSNKTKCFEHLTFAPAISKQYRHSIQMSMNFIQNPSTPRILLNTPTRAAEQKVSTVVLPPLRSIISNLNHLLS